MSALAKRILELDRQYPGDPDAEMGLPAKIWTELVELALVEARPLCMGKIACLGCAFCKPADAHTRGGQPRKSGRAAQVRASTHPDQASAVGNRGRR